MSHPFRHFSHACTDDTDMYDTLEILSRTQLNEFADGIRMRSPVLKMYAFYRWQQHVNRPNQSIPPLFFFQITR